MVVLKPLVARDNLYARFVNFKTAFEETQNPIFNQLKDERVAKVEEKYAELEAKFNEEMTAALNEAPFQKDRYRSDKERVKYFLHCSVFLQRGYTACH